jgi:hypothetical protein
MSCQCFECVSERESAGDYWLNDEQLRFECMTGLGFDAEHVFYLIWLDDGENGVDHVRIRTVKNQDASDDK